MSYHYIQEKKWQSSGRPRFYVEPPVKINMEYEGEIEEIGVWGDGVVRINGFVILVSNTEQGEYVKFKVTRIGKRFAIGESVLD
jgi:predicted RNA-binding protein with TRAM domain